MVKVTFAASSECFGSPSSRTLTILNILLMLGRPCQRCIKRNIGHLCHDEPRPSVAAAATAALGQSDGAQGKERVHPEKGNQSVRQTAQFDFYSSSLPPLERRQSQQPNVQKSSSTSGHQSNQSQQQQQAQQNQMHSSQSSNGMPLYGFGNQMSTLPVTPLTFASEHMGNEFTVIRYVVIAWTTRRN